MIKYRGYKITTQELNFGTPMYYGFVYKDNVELHKTVGQYYPEKAMEDAKNFIDDTFLENTDE